MMQYETTPLSILTINEEYQNPGTIKTMRTVDKSKFVTMKEGIDIADAKDFALYTHKDYGKPKLQAAISKRKHPALSQGEKNGPIWAQNDST